MSIVYVIPKSKYYRAIDELMAWYRREEGVDLNSRCPLCDMFYDIAKDCPLCPWALFRWHGRDRCDEGSWGNATGMGILRIEREPAWCADSLKRLAAWRKMMEEL